MSLLCSFLLNVLIIAKTVVKTVKTVFILVIKVYLRLKRKKKSFKNLSMVAN
jgi:hypothetical protein